MTVTLKRNGDLLVRQKAGEKIGLRAGDQYVVRKSGKRGVVLRRAGAQGTQVPKRRAYLTPKPISRATLERVYSRSDPDWDRVEREAVSASKRILTGMRLEEL
jgi:hypothetical protein